MIPAFSHTIGRRGQLTTEECRKAATAFRTAHGANPDAAFDFHIYGYDDDHRELREVPEVRQYCKCFVQAAGLTDLTCISRNDKEITVRTGSGETITLGPNAVAIIVFCAGEFIVPPPTPSLH